LRAALICLPQPGEVAFAHVGGRSAASCQLELALACKSELVIVHGHGASPDAISLRHRAEQAGARFQTVNDARALIGAIGAADSLLVLQTGLWAEAREVVESLQSPACVLVIPSGAGVQGGFERVDLDRAWAGALVLPGHLLGALAALPDDAAPAPALLRIALQHRLPEIRLPAELVDAGEWSLLRSPEAARAQERLWLSRRVGELRGTSLSQRAARKVLLLSDGALAFLPRSFAAAVTATGLLLMGALTAAWLSHPALAFGLLALTAVLGELTVRLARVRAVPFSTPGKWPLMRHLVDFGMAGCGALAIEGFWQRSLFAPLVLVAGLLLLDRHALGAAAELLRDRGAVALALAALLLVLRPEMAIMALAALVLAANLAPRRG
jgi:hypothetical protein